jgi:hypothetical protein
MSTVNNPSTLLNGPTVEPQNEQCSAIRLLAGQAVARGRRRAM